MKKAILCFPKIESSQNQYPIGLYKIASYCSEEYEIIIIDERIENAYTTIVDLINKYAKDILCLGISVMTGIQIKRALDLSEKFHCELKIVWGGIHTSILPQLTLQNNFIDFVIVGEGEKAFLDLLRYLDGHIIEDNCYSFNDGLTFKEFRYNIFPDFSESVYIDFSKYPISEHYFIRRDGFRRAFNIETSRGCPFKCAFCHNSIFEQKGYRTATIRQTLELVDCLEKNYNIDGLIFQEDNFFVNYSRINTILDFLSTRNIGWKANSRVDFFLKKMVDDRFLKKIVESNCKVLQFGIESGSERILKLINKKLTISQIKEANKILSTMKIKIRYNFIIGFPTETIQEINNTLNLIKELNDENPNMESPFLNVYNPYPGTKLFELALNEGFNAPSSLLEWSKFSWNESNLTYLKPNVAAYITELSQEFVKKVNYPF